MIGLVGSTRCSRLLLLVALIGGPCHAAQLLSPLSDAEINEYNPSFTWQADPSFDRTQIQVASDLSFNTTVNDRVMHSFVNRFVPLDSLPTCDYWWRTRSRDKQTQAWGEWETARRFTVADNPTVNINLSDSYATIKNKIDNSPNRTRIVFEPGTYTFDSSDSGSDIYFMELQNKSNLVIEGNGAEIVFDSSIGNLGFFRARDSNTVSLRNLTLRRDKPLGLPMRITEVDAIEDSFVVERLDTSYPLPSEDSTQYETASAWTIDPDSNKIKFGTTLSLLFDEEQSGPQGAEGWKYYLSSRKYVADNLSPGDIILSGAKYGNRKEIDLQRSNNITVYNFDTQSTGTTFHMLAGNTEGVKVLKSDWVRDGYHGPVSDGMHFKDARVGPWIEGNRIQSNGDDVIAIKPANRSFTRVDDSTIEVSASHSLEVGDLLQFFTGSAFNLTTEGTVTGVNYLGNTKLVTLDSGVVAPSITSYSNYALAAPGTVVSGNVFEDNRGDGFNIGVNGAIFEGNVLRDLGERAFLIHPTEGGGAQSQNVLISGNEFQNMKRFDDLSADPRGSFLSINGQVNKRAENIVIEDNVLYGYPNTALSIEDADGVHVRNNTFSSGEFYDDADIAGDIVRISTTENVYFEDNRFLEFRDRAASERLELTNATGWAADNPDFDSQFATKLWSVDRIGHAEAGSGIAFGDPIPHRSLTAFSLTGSGTMSGGHGSDSATFANVPVEGDAGVKMKVLDLTEPDGVEFARTGVMLRESTDADSAFVMMSLRELGGQWFLQTIFRDATGGALTAAETSAPIDFPLQIGLARNGNTFSSYFSEDGREWELFNSLILDLSSSTLAGVAVTSQGSGLLTTLAGDELLVDTELSFFDFAPLAGDFNDDGEVDAADYTLWRDALGGPESLINYAGDGSGTVDPGDYQVWKAQYGFTDAGTASASAVVPEPAAWLMLLAPSMVFAGTRRRRTRQCSPWIA